MFALVVGQFRQNLGELIYSELRRYHTTSKVSTRVPFPSLVSLILRENQIWYLDPTDSVERPARFDSSHIANMGIELPLLGTQPTYSMKRKKTPPPSQSVPQPSTRAPPASTRVPEDDTQSSAPLPRAPILDESLQTFIRNAIHDAVSPLQARVELLVQHANEQSTALQTMSSALSLFAQAMDTMRGIPQGSSHQIPTPGPIPSSHPTPRPVVAHLHTVDPNTSEPVHVTFTRAPPSDTIPEPDIPEPSHTIPEPDIPEPSPPSEPVIQPATQSPSSSSSTHSSRVEEVIVEDTPGSPTLEVPPVDLPEPAASGGSSAQYRDETPVDEATSTAAESLTRLSTAAEPLRTLEPIFLRLTYPGFPAPEVVDDDKKGENIDTETETVETVPETVETVPEPTETEPTETAHEPGPSTSPPATLP